MSFIDAVVPVTNFKTKMIVDSNTSKMINQDSDDYQDQNKHNQNLELQAYKKNLSFKWEKLEVDNNYTFLTGGGLIFNLWENDFDLQKNLHINDDLEIHYKHGEDCVYFKLAIENISGTTEDGQVKQTRYFRPTSLIQTGLIYDIFAVLEDKICEKLKINFLDIIDRVGLIRITNKQTLPLNKVVYLKDFIVIFERVDKVTYKGKTKYCIVSNIIAGDVLLPKV